MKRIVLIVFSVLMLALCSCNGQTSTTPEAQKPSQGESAWWQSFSLEEEEEESFLDLAVLDAAEQYNKAVEIQIYFEEFAGKTVRFGGQYYTGDDGYHYLTVADNANCCYTDFELVTRDGSYPEEKSWVIVEGVLGYYQLDGEEFPHIDVYKVEPWN